MGNVGLTAYGGYDGIDPDKGVNRNQRAIHVLSNGNKIYDFSGNL